MAIVQGNVVRTNTREVNTRRGPATTYSLLVNTGTSEDWINFGFDQPACSEGDSVQFETKMNGQYTNGIPASVKVLENAPAPAGAAVTDIAAPRSRPVSNDTRQNSIVRQSSVERAILVMGGLLEAGAITLPTKKADKFEAYLDIVDDIADRFFLDAIEPATADEVRARLYGIEASAQGLADEQEDNIGF